jgi:hypothetical protein
MTITPRPHLIHLKHLKFMGRPNNFCWVLFDFDISLSHPNITLCPGYEAPEEFDRSVPDIRDIFPIRRLNFFAAFSPSPRELAAGGPARGSAASPQTYRYYGKYNLGLSQDEYILFRRNCFLLKKSANVALTFTKSLLAAAKRTPQETEFFNQLLRRNFHPDRLIEAAYHTNNQNITNNHASSETKIGEIHVHTHATDAARIARDIKPVLERTGLATQANYSLA